MVRRRGEPPAHQILRFIADHEALDLTLDEFPKLTDARLREIISEIAGGLKGTSQKRSGTAKKPGSASLKVVVATDGAARGNPGPAGAGWVIDSTDGETLEAGGAFLGVRTNNQAEYEAVIGGLQAASALGAKEVHLRSDSELLVKQIEGKYRIKNEKLRVLHEMARDLIRGFKRFRIQHIPRAENAAADAQANRAIDEQHGR